MDLLNRTAFASIPKPPHVFEAESFRAGLKEIYERLQLTQEADEEIAAFYGNIRVYHIKMMANSVLILEGENDAGTHVVVAGHFTSVHLIYTKLKLAPKKKRTPIGFSTSGEESNGGTR